MSGYIVGGSADAMSARSPALGPGGHPVHDLLPVEIATTWRSLRPPARPIPLVLCYGAEPTTVVR